MAGKARPPTGSRRASTARDDSQPIAALLTLDSLQLMDAIAAAAALPPQRPSWAACPRR